MINSLKTYVNPLCGMVVSVASDYCPIRLFNSNLATSTNVRTMVVANAMHRICSNYEWSLRLKKNSKLTYGSWHYKHWRYNTMFARVFDLNRDNCNSKYNLYHGKSLAFSVWYLLVHDKIYGATKESGQFTTLNIWLYQRANLYSLCWEKSFKIRSLMNANAKYSLFRRFLNQNFSQFLCAFDTVCHKTLLFETL